MTVLDPERVNNRRPEERASDDGEDEAVADG